MAETTTSTTSTSTSTTSTSTTTTSTSTTTTSTTSTTSTSTTLAIVTIEDVRSAVQFIIQDDSGLIKPTEKELAINNAVRIYSKDRPYKKIHEDSTPNGAKYDFDLPFDWVDGFSYIDGSIEYPVSSSFQTPSYLDNNAWTIYKTITSIKLRFTTLILGTNYSFRFTYAIPHIVNDDNCTIYENDIDAVNSLAASFVFRALAAKYSQTSEPTIDADVIDYATKSEYYSNLAQTHFEIYQTHVGAGNKTEEKPGAMAMKDLDMAYAWKSDYLTHPKGTR